MTAERPPEDGQERPVNLPTLRQPFGRHEVAQWWGDIEKKMGAERPPAVPLHRPVVGLTALAVLLGASGALAIVWPRLAPPPAPPPVASVAAAEPSGSSAQQAPRRRGPRPAASQAPEESPDLHDASPDGAPASDAPATSAAPPAHGAPGAPGAAPAALHAGGSSASAASARGEAASGSAAGGSAAGGAPRDAGDDAPGRRPWRELARRGAFGDAYTELGASGGVAQAAAAASVDDLFALADVARLSGHPREAVAPLSQIVQRGGGQAALASFTLGRLRLDQLGEAAAAAQDFERAVALGLGGALREDALVRRITALGRSGQVAQAREAAVSYAALFPASRRRVEAWLPKDE